MTWRNIREWARQMEDQTGLRPTRVALGDDIAVPLWDRLVCFLYLKIRVHGGKL